MVQEKIDLAEPPGTYQRAFNRQHFSFRHDFVGHPLFELDRLADLTQVVLAAAKDDMNHHIAFKTAETVPNSAKQWTNFKTTERVYEAVRNIRDSKSWVLITGAEVDKDYQVLLDEMLTWGEQTCHENFKSETIWSTLSILIGSPNSVTHYHLDSESNFLFQIHGDKEAHLFNQYDRSVIREDEIEKFVVNNGAHIEFDPRFEKTATVYDLHAGDGVHIPPFAPHWVRNLSEYSITATALFYTRSATRRAWVYQCNHLLRAAGLKPTPPGNSALLDNMKAGLIGVISTNKPTDKHDILKSGVRRLVAPARFLHSKFRG